MGGEDVQRDTNLSLGEFSDYMEIILKSEMPAASLPTLVDLALKICTISCKNDPEGFVLGTVVL